MDIIDALSTLGFSAILYFLARLINFFVLLREDRGVPESLLDTLLSYLTAFLGFLSLPVSIPMGFLNQAYANRQLKQHDRDMATAHLKYIGKCQHCYSKIVSQSRPFGYDKDHLSWTDTSTDELYIPAEDAWPSLSTAQIKERCTQAIFDLYTAYQARYPFSPEHIGQENPYSYELIKNESDYNDYLISLAKDHMNSQYDPFEI